MVEEVLLPEVKELIDFEVSPPTLPVETPPEDGVSEKPPPTDFSEAVKQIQ